jgi:hypothetical protein
MIDTIKKKMDELQDGLFAWTSAVCRIKSNLVSLHGGEFDDDHPDIRLDLLPKKAICRVEDAIRAPWINASGR